MEKSAIVESDE